MPRSSNGFLLLPGCILIGAASAPYPALNIKAGSICYSAFPARYSGQSTGWPGEGPVGLTVSTSSDQRLTFLEHRFGRELVFRAHQRPGEQRCTGNQLRAKWVREMDTKARFDVCISSDRQAGTSTLVTGSIEGLTEEATTLGMHGIQSLAYCSKERGENLISHGDRMIVGKQIFIEH